MGAFFTNCHVRTTEAAKCAKGIETSITSRALMTDSKNGWITIYDEESESQDPEILRRLAKNLSTKLKTVAVAMMVHDSDIFRYLVYENGRAIDQFDSKPDYFGAVSDALRKKWRGDFAKLLGYVKGRTTLSDLKRAAEKKLVVEEERAGEFAQMLGIDSDRARTGYKYVHKSPHAFKLVYAKTFSREQAELVEAVSKGDLLRVRTLLDKGISPNQKDQLGVPLIVASIRYGRLEIARDLIEHGADVFAQGPVGGDAVWIAAAEGHQDIVEFLIGKTMGDEKLAASVRTAFPAAVMAGHVEIMRHLIRAGADVNANTPWGHPPLTLASIRGQEFIWETKMKRPFPRRPGERRTDWKEVVMILLESGAQIPFPMKDGPLDVNTLSSEQKSKLADRLLEAGAKIKLP